MISVAAEHLGNGEAKAALAAVQDQLHNYARVQHALQMPEHSSRIDAAVYLRQLCRAICCAKLNAKGIELLLVERTFQMDSERCWRLGWSCPSSSQIQLATLLVKMEALYA